MYRIKIHLIPLVACSKTKECATFFGPVVETNHCLELITLETLNTSIVLFGVVYAPDVLVDRQA